MAISLIGSNIQDKNGGRDLTFTLPAAAQAGDLLLVFVKQSENTTQRIWDDDGGGGRGYVRAAYNRTTGGRDMETAIYWKLHSGSETNPIFTWAESSITSEPMGGVLLAYRGVDQFAPIQSVNYLEGQNNAAPPNPTTPLSSFPATVVAFHGATHDDITAVAAPTGFTLRGQVWNGVNDDHRNLFAADITIASGTAGDYVAPKWNHSVLNTTPEYHTYTVALREPQPIGLLSPLPLSSTYQSTITIDGYGFNNTQGSGGIELWSDLAGSIKTPCVINSWSENQIEFVVTRGALTDDVVVYVSISNSDGDVIDPLPLGVGLLPYQTLINVLEPDHHWPLDGNYDETQQGFAMTVTPQNGGGAFEPVTISEDTAQSHRFVLNQRRESPNSSGMNSATTDNRLMGGWIRLETISAALQCIYEEGGGVNNLAFFVGMGNNLVAQLADTADDNVQAFSDFPLEPGRAYHILFRFSYTDTVKEFRLYIDGQLQGVTSGNPLVSIGNHLDAHGGDISFGGPGGNLEVAGTDVLFRSAEDCYFSNWITFSTSQPQTVIDDLFQRGAVPDITLSGTQAQMQSQLTALANTALPNSPLNLRLTEPTDGIDLSVVADNVVFDPKSTIHVEWRGQGTLTWKNTNGANLVDEKIFKSKSGNVVLINPAILTLTGLVPGSEVRIYENGTDVELGGIESSGSSFSTSVEVPSVRVVVMALAYQNLFIEGVVTAADRSLPIQQLVDRQYRND